MCDSPLKPVLFFNEKINFLGSLRMKNGQYYFYPDNSSFLVVCVWGWGGGVQSRTLLSCQGEPETT